MSNGSRFSGVADDGFGNMVEIPGWVNPIRKAARDSVEFWPRLVQFVDDYGSTVWPGVFPLGSGPIWARSVMVKGGAQ